MSRRVPVGNAGCGPGNRCQPNRHWHGFGPRDLTRVADAFRLSRKIVHSKEMRFYASHKSWDEALRVAALCISDKGKMHAHQTRLGKDKIKGAYQRLKRVNLQSSRNFEDLIQQVDAAVRDLPGIGVLYVYDVAQRLGAWLKLKPQRVYLHAGTRQGARALGLSARSKSLALVDLPPTLRRMSPSLLEDFFCICKECLRPSMLGGNSARR